MIGDDISQSLIDAAARCASGDNSVDGVKRVDEAEQVDEAGQIKVGDLSTNSKKMATLIEKSFGVKLKSAVSGVGGDVLSFDGRDIRLGGDSLKKLAKTNIRFIEFGNNFIDVGV